MRVVGKKWSMICEKISIMYIYRNKSYSNNIQIYKEIFHA